MTKLNQALLAKVGCLILSSHSSPWIQVVQAKYHKHETFWNVSPTPNSSWLWKRILRTRPLLSQWFCHLIRDGSCTRVWTDPWIPSLANFKPIPKDDTISQTQNLTVSTLIHPITRQWFNDILEALFDPVTIHAIKLLQPAHTSLPDKLIWKPDRKGKFSVKSAYHLTLQTSHLVHTTMVKNDWIGLCNLKIHARLKHFLWKTAWDILPTGQRLNKIRSSSLNIDTTS